jgi:hypothetical protein
MAIEYKKTFKLNPRWQYIYNNLPSFDYGIAIRRGDFLDYFPGDHHKSIDSICSKISNIEGSKYIVSDDNNYKKEIKERTQILADFNLDNPLDMAMLDFLILAKCKKVIGTKGSSFAKQASLFGNNNYETL